MPQPDERIQELLLEAAVEIARLDGPANPVYLRLTAALQQELRPLSTTIGEVAQLYDVPPADALDEAIRSGCRLFWWEGKPHGVQGVRQLIKDWWRWDVTPEIAVDLSPEESARLEQAFGGELVAAAQATASKAPRKFTPSEANPPNLAATKRQQLG